MGASAWAYYAPYQENIQALLDELRKKEYLEQKDHYRRRIEISMGWIQEMPDNEFNEYLDSDDLYADFAPASPPSREELIRWRVDLEPRSPDELLKLLVHEGARSIIDIRAVSEDPGNLQLFPMPEGRLPLFFGTEEPTRNLLEERKREFEDFIHQHVPEVYYAAVYFPLYDDRGEPAEIFIYGVTGD